MLRRLRDLVQRLEVPLYFVTATLAIYLAIANILRAAKWPDEATWTPGSIWFLMIVGCAVYVPVYALYKALDAHFEKLDKRAAEEDERRATLNRDLELICQQTVAAIADRCARVAVNDLAAQVWICRDDDGFDRVARFYLPHERASTGIGWRKGKGVAGMAWKADRNLRANLEPLQQQLQGLGDARFDKLPADARYGMTASELRNAADYTGICAIRLFPTGSKLLAMFIIDYVGSAEFDCVARASGTRPVTIYLGGCETILTAAHDIL